MMKIFASCLQVLGVIAIVAGAALIFVPAAFVLGGAGLILIGLALGK
jgi:hypothetical protein